jgi:hypothetical protein
MNGTQAAKQNMFALLKMIWIDATDKGVVSCELYESFRTAFGYDLFVYLLGENATLSLEERKKKKKPSKTSRRSKPSTVINIPDNDMNDRLDRIEKTLREIQHSQQRVEVALKIEGSSAALSLDADNIGQAVGKEDVEVVGPYRCCLSVKGRSSWSFLDHSFRLVGDFYCIRT